MENATDALKMAFAVFIFIFALSLAFSTITQAKETADIVLFVNDKTNYQDELEYTSTDLYGKQGRVVGIDTVISTLYRCKNETMVVEVDDWIHDETSVTLTQKMIKFDSTEDKGELNNKIETFIKNIKHNKDAKYLEIVSEAKYSGKEITADDGSSIVVTKGGSKMYIVYEVIHWR